MKWLILASHPARLHALLESAARHLPNIEPDLILDESQVTPDLMNAYSVFSGSGFKGMFRLATQSHFWREAVLTAIQAPRKNGSIEPMAMVTPDTMLFTRKVVLRDAWDCLSDEETLGVSLGLGVVSDWVHFEERRWVGKRTSAYTWKWPDVPGIYGHAFSYGTVYRTGDLLGPLCRNEWDSPETLRDALSNDATLRRRPRMACLPEPALIDCHVEDESMNARYCGGDVIDIDRLPDTPNRYYWKPYTEGQ